MNSVFDKLLRWLRYKKVVNYIPENSVICDIGCGPDAYFLKKISSLIQSGIGLDRNIKEYKDPKIELRNLEVFKDIPLGEERFDVVTMMAVLEHLKHPQEILKECYRILKKNGRLILTTPVGKIAGQILEFSAFKLNLIDKKEIADHKNYFKPKEVKEMLLKAGFKGEKIKNYPFEFSLNILIIAQK